MSLYGALCDGAMLLRSASQYVRETATRRAARDADPAAAGASMLCVTTTVSSYPTTATAVFAVLPQELDADDSEGASSTASSDSDQKFFAINLGSAVPPSGTQVVCHGVGGRWVFRYDG